MFESVLRLVLTGSFVGPPGQRGGNVALHAGYDGEAEARAVGHSQKDLSCLPSQGGAAQAVVNIHLHGRPAQWPTCHHVLHHNLQGKGGLWREKKQHKNKYS